MKKLLYILIPLIILIIAFYFFINQESKISMQCDKNHPDQQDSLWYYAYGSNLYKPRFIERIGPWQKEQPAILKGYKRVYESRHKGSNAYANILADENSEVQGALYLISPDQAKILDKYEGVPDHYIRIYVPFDGLGICGFAYQFSGQGFPGEPIEQYKNYIKDGLKDFGFKE